MIKKKNLNYIGLQSLYWVVSLCFVGIILVIDLSLPLGVATGSLYLFPIFLATFLIDSKYAPLTLSFLCSALILGVLFLSSEGNHNHVVVINRVTSVFFLILGTIAISIYKTTIINSKWSEQKLSAALNGAPNGILLVNKKGAITYANHEIERLFGYDQKELLSMNVDSLVPTRFRKDHPSHRNSFSSKPERRAMGAGRDLYGLGKGGIEVPIEIGLTPIKFGEEFFVMSSVIDITERKKHEAERENIIQKLKLSNQELDDFAYIASHDLKEPLRGIFNNAKFLLEDFEDKLDEEGVRRLNRLTYLCQRMETLVNDLLYFSRLGRQELAIQETDLNIVIKDLMSLLETSLKERKAEVRIIRELPKIVCDRPRISEVFHNLISNGIKYNDSEHKLIEVGWLGPQEAGNPSNQNLYYVRDNGIGIDREFHKEIFRIFKRLNEEDDTKKGTGVGLTFIKKIIERHGGKIWVESQLGLGSTFYFNLEQGEAIE